MTLPNDDRVQHTQVHAHATERVCVLLVWRGIIIISNRSYFHSNELRSGLCGVLYVEWWNSGRQLILTVSHRRGVT